MTKGILWPSCKEIRIPCNVAPSSSDKVFTKLLKKLIGSIEDIVPDEINQTQRERCCVALPHKKYREKLVKKTEREKVLTVVLCRIKFKDQMRA